MLTRRHFIATGAAAAALPAALPGAVQAASSYRVPEQFMPQVVRVKPEFAAGELHVTPTSHFLYYVLGGGQAIRYGVAVGAEGRNFSGEAVIGAKKEWPSWTPTKSMIEREPEKYAQYADGMPGGPNNPLGARALYLFKGGRDTFYRIHGTPQPWSIGRSVSSGCIRMINAHVSDLYERVPVGATVMVHPSA